MIRPVGNQERRRGDTPRGWLRSAWAGAARSIARGVEEYRAKFIYRALDAALTADPGKAIQADASKGDTSAGSPRYRRARRLVNAAAAFLPARVTGKLEKGFQPGRLPFPTDHVKLLSFGSGSTVFLVHLEPATDGAEPPPVVLKIWRRSLGRKLEVLRRQMRQRREVYERIAGWYRGTGVVLSTHFVILHGPVLAGPSVAFMQSYVDGKNRDIFHDFDESELMRKLRENPSLHRQFSRFAERTLHSARAEGACVDILGRGNVVLDQEERLRLLDHGIFDFAVKRRRHPEAVGRMRERLDWLGRMRDAAAPCPGGENGTPEAGSAETRPAETRSGETRSAEAGG